MIIRDIIEIFDFDRIIPLANNNHVSAWHTFNEEDDYTKAIEELSKELKTELEIVEAVKLKNIYKDRRIGVLIKVKE